MPDAAPADIQKQEEARIWGTTEGRQKRTFFEEMETGDPLLFYNTGEFFAAGRVGTAFENPKVGEALWNNSDSRFIYTVTDYQEITVQREKLALLLGYEEEWVPYRFLRVSPDAVSSLLRQYNSIEEAFQDFQNGGEIDEPDNGEDEPREHTEIQWRLIQLGLAHGYDVYVAKNDKNRTYDGNRLGEDCLENLNLPGFSSAATRIIEYVDVIWLEDDFIVKMFEVESTTSIFSGILRMTDFMVKVPNIAVEMHIVAPDDDEDKVREEINRPTFQHVLEPAEHCSLRYLSFEEVRDTHDTVEQAGPLQHVF
ncbi:hypothetical protein ACFQJ5_10095 [Halomicroarcula sp. GCM10025324]|uniref:hypothetical protein n=1 Tax=Haloarcula TaxID=2237 RepID=UPI0023E7795A|nr:hypothetical protein [Halomicroarcula sp. ZS-22-S1]